MHAYHVHIVCILLQWNLFLGLLLFKGHLHSGDTKFGPPKEVQDNNNYYSLYFVTPVEGPKRKETIFLVPKPQFNLHSLRGHLN